MEPLSRKNFLRMSGACILGSVALATGTGCASTTTGTTSQASTTSSSASPLADDASLPGGSGIPAFYKHVKSVTALGTILPAGEKIIGVAIEYDTDIDGSSLELGSGGIGQQAIKAGLGSYYAIGRTVSKVYAYDKAAIDPAGTGAEKGSYVILELNQTDANARTMLFQFTRGSVGCDGPVSLDTATIRVCQVGDIKDASGTVIAGDPTRSRYLDSSTVSNASVDAFTTGYFEDATTGYAAGFALKEPEGYDSSKSYPLVLFLPDAGVTSDSPEVNLRQGLGAISWGDDDNCFVLTVAGACADITTCLDLIDALADKGYAIDQSRIYGTGESAGCMALIAYGAEHPSDSRFAAFLLVAGQGNMTPITTTPMFIVVSEDDESSYGGMTDATTGLSSMGIPYVDVQWDCTYDYSGKGSTSGLWVDYAATGQQNPSGNQSGAKAASSTRTLAELMGTLESQATAAIDQASTSQAHVIFAHIALGTLDGTDSSIGGGNTHNFTWQYAYNIPQIREWILSQAI